jgi:hypothetical protein
MLSPFATPESIYKSFATLFLFHFLISEVPEAFSLVCIVSILYHPLVTYFVLGCLEVKLTRIP